MHITINSCPLLWLAAACLALPAASEASDQRACRSVHLHYAMPGALAFYNEVTVEHTVPGTYFCVCGFRRGYFGLQELNDGQKVLIFSVWDDYDSNDPDAVPEERRVEELYHGEGVTVRRFGNEGTGGQSFLDFDWQLGETYRFLVTAELLPERTAFTAWFFDPAAEEWFRMTTFSTFTHEFGVRGLYSFVEDFRRDFTSATQMRRALFRNGWIQSADGQWISLTRAKFTADDTNFTNIDGGADGDVFYLQTGGDTQQQGAAIDEEFDRLPAGVPAFPPPPLMNPEEPAVNE